MARTLPPLNALRAFDAAARHESFSQAAVELNVSHSAISRHVRGLEHRLGVALFKDMPRGVTLTATGRTYLERVQPALDVIAEATDDLAAVPRGRVTINSEPLFAARFIIPRLGRFQAEFPDIEVRLDSSPLLADVDRYEADIAVRHSASGHLDGPGDLLSAALIYPHVSPDMAAHIASPGDFLEVPRLRDRQTNIWRAWFAAAGVSADGLTDSGWRLKSPLAYEAGLNGLGAYLGSSECVSHDLGLGRFVRCFDIGIRDGAFFLIAGAKGARRNAVRQVRTWLLDETRMFRDDPTYSG